MAHRQRRLERSHARMPASVILSVPVLVVKGALSGRMVLLSTVFASETRIAPVFRALDLLVTAHLVVLGQLAIRHLLPAVRAVRSAWYVLVVSV